MVKAVKFALSAGGNVGNVEKSILLAVEKLKDAGVGELRLSGRYRTEPVDCAPGTPDFINVAVTGFWSGSALELLNICQNLEVESGRPRQHGVNQPRTLDLDLILFGDEIVDTAALKVPHPRAKGRRFVLEPLAEIAEDMRFPDCGKSVKELFAEILQE